MSVPSNLGGSEKTPIEDKYKGESTADLLADDISDEKQSEDIPLVEPEEKVEEKEDLLEEPKEEKKVKKEDDKEEEIELEDEEPEEGTEPVFPVPARVITAKYPNLFKDFPHLKVAMFRDKQYTEMFGTVDDAKEALDSKERLDNIQRDIFSGNITDILNEVKQTDQNAFHKLVDNYLPALMQADQVAYLTQISNVGKGIISELYNAAKAVNNPEMEAAAIVLHQFLFPNMGYQPPQRLAKQEAPKDESVEQQKQQLAQQQFNGVLGHITTRVENTLKATINEHIDPKGQMTAYEKKNAVNDALNMLYDEIGSDSYFRPYYDKLWQKAAQNGFRNQQDIDAIEKAYKARAKTRLRDVITKVRNEALKGSGASKGDDKDRKGPIRPGRTASASQNRSNMSTSEKAKAIPKNMSTLDYLNSDD